MSLTLHKPSFASSENRLDYARQVFRAEAAALSVVADRLDASFLEVVDLLKSCSGDNVGRVAITGTGKSADVGQKIAGTLNSTGTRAYLLDATRAVHGDLGMLHPEDVALVLSNSGESEEVVRLLAPLRPLVRAIVALTGKADSTLARQADHALVYGPLSEICPLGLAPSASTTTMIALGDALAFSLSRERNFRQEDFARFHPAGSLGRKLMGVNAVMRTGEELRLASDSLTIREVFRSAKQKGRRTGAVVLVDDANRLSGIFTDSDLARLIERRRDEALDRPIAEVMTPRPHSIDEKAKLPGAIDLFLKHKISELPVVDEQFRPVGLIDITDLLGVVSAEQRKALELPERLGA